MIPALQSAEFAVALTFFIIQTFLNFNGGVRWGEKQLAAVNDV